MEITRIQRQAAEETATDTQRELYESGEPLREIATKFGITDSTSYRTFAVMVGDIILGFYTQADISSLIAEKLPQIDGMKRIGLEADIKLFLYPLTQQVAPPVTTSNDAALSSEIAEAEKSLESLQGIRTMAADMQAVEPAARTEQVHSSSQEEILTPKAAFGGQQRWDTEA